MKSSTERTERVPDGRKAPDAARPREAPGAPIRKNSTVTNARSLAMLQRSAGNAAVASMMGHRGAGTEVAMDVQTAPDISAGTPVQRAVAGSGCPEPPVAPSAPDPQTDPAFAAVAGTVNKRAGELKKHPTASAEVDKAQAAAAYSTICPRAPSN